MEEEMSPLCRLPDDLWRFIGLKLYSPADRIRFRAVSKSWMSLLPFQQPPWLMLSTPGEEESPDHHLRMREEEEESPVEEDEEEEEEEDTTWLTVLGSDFDINQNLIPPRGFVCLGEQKIRNIDLPEIHKGRCIGSTGNWIITIHMDETIQLLNPFSRSCFYLPPVMSLEYNINRISQDRRSERHVSGEILRDYCIFKVILSSPPSAKDGRDCVAMILHHRWLVVAVARPGDSAWTTVYTAKTRQWRPLDIEDMIFYKQRFHAIDVKGRLLVCDDLHSTISYLSIKPLENLEKKNEYPSKKIYLVECLGELLGVVKVFGYFKRLCLYHTHHFEVYKFDFKAKKFKELNNLGEHSLFLGYNTSVSVLASDYHGLVKKNCIYFTDDYLLGYQGNYQAGGHDMGVFDLEDKNITPHYEGVSVSYYSPPVWIIPT